MYRQHEDACPDCLQLLSHLLAQAQAYVTHLGTLRPTNQWKKDDDLHGHPWAHPAAPGARVQLLHSPPQVAGVAIAPLRMPPPYAHQPSVYDAYTPSDRSHAPLYQEARGQARSVWDAAGSSSQALAHECASPRACCDVHASR